MKQYIAKCFGYRNLGDLDVTEYSFLEYDTEEITEDGTVEAQGVNAAILLDVDEDFNVTEDSWFVNEFSGKVQLNDKEIVQIKEEDYRLALAISGEALSKRERAEKMKDLFSELWRKE